MSFLYVIRRRLILLLLVVFGVTIITFAISHMIPGDPARLMAGDRATPEIVQSMRVRLGLDQPLHVQYLNYVGDLLRGDLGTSIRTGRPVADDLVRFFRPPLNWASLLFSR